MVAACKTQFFCRLRYDYIQWEFPIHPTTLVKWRKRVSPKGLEKVISSLLDAALEAGMVKKESLKAVIADTTVMPKAIAFATDAALYCKGIKHLVRFGEPQKLKYLVSYPLTRGTFVTQLSFASFTPKTKSKLRPDQFLDEMRAVVPWKRIARLIKSYYYNKTTGRPPYDLITMIKIHCLQQWYNCRCEYYQ